MTHLLQKLIWGSTNLAAAAAANQQMMKVLKEKNIYDNIQTPQPKALIRESFKF